MYEAQLADLPIPSCPPPTSKLAYEPTDWGEIKMLPLPPRWDLNLLNTAIVDAGASGLYFMPDAPVTNVKEDAPKITVGTASGQPFVSKATCEMARP